MPSQVGTLDGAREAMASGDIEAWLWEKFTTKHLVDTGAARAYTAWHRPRRVAATGGTNTGGIWFCERPICWKQYVMFRAKRVQLLRVKTCPIESDGVLEIPGRDETGGAPRSKGVWGSGWTTNSSAVKRRPRSGTSSVRCLDSSTGRM